MLSFFFLFDILILDVEAIHIIMGKIFSYDEVDNGKAHKIHLIYVYVSFPFNINLSTPASP